MQCPKCKQPMIVVEHQGIELDHCLSCKGIWFDHGELDLLFQDLQTGEEPIESLPAAKTTEKPRRCPRCRRKMKKVYIGDAPRILIDACDVGEGLWFDAGEVGALIRETLRKIPGAAGKTIAFLGEVFQAPPTEGGRE